MEVYSRNKSRGVSWTAAIVLMLLAALIAGGAAFLWQASTLNKVYKENTALNEELKNVKNAKESLENEKLQLEKDVQSLKDQLPQDGEKGRRQEIQDMSDEVLRMLKDKDMSRLSKLVHPDKGVRFTPYSYIDENKDVKIAAAGFSGLMAETKKRQWGSFDGTGDPIDMTFPEYYKKFVYDADFLEAPQIVFNQPVQRGNSLVNVKEIYPDALFVEYHIPGIDPQYNGMDWRSLLLVWEQKDTNWYLVGIIHNQWTI